MRSLYRLQTRLGLTGPEGSALLALALAGALGVGAMEAQEHAGAPSAALYAEADAAFAAASRSAPPAAQVRGDAPAPAPLALLDTAAAGAPVAAGAPTAEPAPGAAPEAAPEAAPPPPVTAGRSSGRKVPGRANLNTGGVAELQRLPGVGPAIAQRIVDYRARHGPFRSVDAVTGVKGIGPKTLEKMRGYAHL